MTTPAKKSPRFESKPEPAPLERLTYGLNELAAVIGVSRRSIERDRSAGRFPKPDMKIGKRPLWRVETIQEWIKGGGSK